MKDHSERLQDHIRSVVERIPSHIQVCAAAKSRQDWEIEAAIQCGISFIGMNYVQETKQVRSRVAGVASWSFLGKIQTSNISPIASLFDVVETVDDLEKLCLLNKYYQKLNKKICALIEINIAHEPQKGGISPEYVDSFLSEVEEVNLCQIEIEGLMTMGPANVTSKEYEKMFTTMRLLFEKRKSWSTLSMGMSDTWEIAVACGATRVRLGTSLFGERVGFPRM